MLERGLILTRETGQVTAETLSFLQVIQTQTTRQVVIQLPPGGILLEQVQISLVKQALQSAGNNQTTAAKLLGLSRSKFRVMVKNMDGEQ